MQLLQSALVQVVDEEVAVFDELLQTIETAEAEYHADAIAGNSLISAAPGRATKRKRD